MTGAVAAATGGRSRVGALLDRLPRPLDPIRSIKLKLSILLVASGAAAGAYFWYRVGSIPPLTLLVALCLALLVAQVLAHGMTSPLREMTAAAPAMARGDHGRRVRATSRDEVGELARAFNQMAADLAAADRQRRELIANVSHELRTPIAALHAMLENLVDGVAQPEPAMLRATLAQTERLGRLVTDLLDLSRLEAGAVPLEPEAIEVAAFLDQVGTEIRVTAAGAGVTFAVAACDQLTVTADRDRLHQVFANLLDNAARHSPAGGTVTVTAEKSGGATVFHVLDQGPGIPAEQRATVFERFTRGERASGGGSGLGLAIAHWAVQLHDGTVAVVDPPVGTGCAVRVSIPDRPPPTPSAPPTASGGCHDSFG